MAAIALGALLQGAVHYLWVNALMLNNVWGFGLRACMLTPWACKSTVVSALLCIRIRHVHAWSDGYKTSRLAPAAVYTAKFSGGLWHLMLEH
jgi:hypothetical protein